jgi:hypothetical protein
MYMDGPDLKDTRAHLLDLERVTGHVSWRLRVDNEEVHANNCYIYGIKEKTLRMHKTPKLSRSTSRWDLVLMHLSAEVPDATSNV